MLRLCLGLVACAALCLRLAPAVADGSSAAATEGWLVRRDWRVPDLNLTAGLEFPRGRRTRTAAAMTVEWRGLGVTRRGPRYGGVATSLTLDVDAGTGGLRNGLALHPNCEVFIGERWSLAVGTGWAVPWRHRGCLLLLGELVYHLPGGVSGERWWLAAGWRSISANGHGHQDALELSVSRRLW